MSAISSDYVRDTCRLGEGEDCCAYLMMGSGGFECAKDNGFADAIRARLEDGQLGAQGDHCEGWDRRAVGT